MRALGERAPAQLLFVGKSHDLFAAVEGELIADNDRALIDRLWNPYVAAWFEGGQDDPNLQLLRFEPGRAQIWENDNSLFAGARILLGRDPKADYADKTTEVRAGADRLDRRVARHGRAVHQRAGGRRSRLRPGAWCSGCPT